MHDIRQIIENEAIFKKKLQIRGVKSKEVDDVINKYHKKNKLQQEVDNLRARLNDISKDPGWLKDGRLIQPAGEIKKELKPLEKKLKSLEKDYKLALYSLPNLPLENVPTGGEESNKILKIIGQPTLFDYKIKDHVELSEKHDLLDLKRAAKVSGSRFAYIKNELVFLEYALIQYSLDLLTKEGFIPVIPPVLINREITDELGYWNGKIDDKHTANENYYLVYDPQDDSEEKGSDSSKYLIGTSEHVVVPMHSNETFNDEELPKKYASISSCFRREAGTYGKDNKGILRVHQFDKVEMIAIVKPEDDERERAKLLNLAEQITEGLELPYRVVQLATGDLSLPSAETIDIETWIPSQNTYRETHSISTTTNFQSRRLKIRYKTKNPARMELLGVGGGERTEYVHLLNGTAVAVGRMLIAILENYQQKDGSILVPKVLHKYTNFKKIPA